VLLACVDGLPGRSKWQVATGLEQVSSSCIYSHRRAVRSASVSIATGVQCTVQCTVVYDTSAITSFSSSAGPPSGPGPTVVDLMPVPDPTSQPTSCLYLAVIGHLQVISWLLLCARRKVHAGIWRPCMGHLPYLSGRTQRLYSIQAQIRTHQCNPDNTTP
jgi:hypothetical protein